MGWTSPATTTWPGILLTISTAPSTSHSLPRARSARLVDPELFLCDFDPGPAYQMILHPHAVLYPVLDPSPILL